MITTAQIKGMTSEEKLQTMELLWDELASNSEEMISAPWHKKILEQTEEKIAGGEDHFVSWELAKKQLRTMFE
jgi:hypothetical protein